MQQQTEFTDQMTALSNRLGHLTALRRIFLDKPLVVQLYKNVLAFSETCRFILSSQGFAYRLCLETEESNSYSHILFHKPRSILLSTSHIHSGFSYDVFPSDFPIKVCHTFITFRQVKMSAQQISLDSSP